MSHEVSGAFPSPNLPLSKEDYEEPLCPLKKPGGVTPIPTRRVIDRLDSYLDRNDYPAARRHLAYWLAEADSCGDQRGKLTILNEQIGLFRKLGEEAEGLQAIEGALALAQSLELEGTATLGTTLINAATAYRAFDRAQSALPLYEKARTLYEALLRPDDERLGALYNNMALTLTALGSYREAESLFHKALGVMSLQEHGQAELAITYLNLADLLTAQYGEEADPERIGAWLDRAEALLDTPDLPRDGYYAFVCEKCAPAFTAYGRSLTGQKLTERAKEIYERT